MLLAVLKCHAVYPDGAMTRTGQEILGTWAAHTPNKDRIRHFTPHRTTFCHEILAGFPHDT